MVEAPAKILSALRKREASELVREEIDSGCKVRKQAHEPKAAAKPPVMAPSQVVFDPDHRPRYATTKMQPDELEERTGFDGKGMGKGMSGIMGGPGGMGGF